MSSSVVKAVDGLIIPEKIPGDDLWSGDIGAVADGLAASAKALRSDAEEVTAGWAGLPAVFVAPGAEVVWGAVAPASASAQVFAEKVDVIAKALHHYADGLPVLKRTFAAIKADAVTFRAKIGADGRVWMSPAQTKKYEWDSRAQVGRAQGAQDAVDYLRSRGETARVHYGAVQLRALWTESGEFIDQNNRLLDRVADAYASLNKLEAECANKINSQRDDCVADVVAVKGWQLKQGGAQTADLPWGHRVDEDRNCGESFWWGAGNAGLSTVQGLGSLISYNPTTNGWGDWDNAGKAWVGVGTGLGSLLLASFSLTPILAAAGVPLFKDAQDKTGDMLKSLVAWDTWSKNPSEAAGAVLVNVGTFFIPGAGEVGGAIKALTIGTKLEIVASALTKVEAVTSKVTSLIPDALGDLLTKLKTNKVDINIDTHVEIPTDIHATIGAHPDTPTLHTGGGDHAPDLTRGGHTDTPVALHDHPDSPATPAVDGPGHPDAPPSYPDPSTSDHGGTSEPHSGPTDPHAGSQHLDPNAPADLDHSSHVPQHVIDGPGSEHVSPHTPPAEGVDVTPGQILTPSDRAALNTDGKRWYVAIFDRQASHAYWEGPSSTLGVSGRPFFVSPIEDAAHMLTVDDAARLTGMSPATQRALTGFEVGKDGLPDFSKPVLESDRQIVGFAFETDPANLPRTPIPDDAQGWSHFLEGGNTAVRLGDGPEAGYLLNPTREFVIGGGTPLSATTGFRWTLLPGGSWGVERVFG